MHAQVFWLMNFATEAPRHREEDKIFQVTTNQAMEAARAQWWPWIEGNTASLLLHCWRHNNILVMSAGSAFANPHGDQPKQAMFKT